MRSWLGWQCTTAGPCWQGFLMSGFDGRPMTWPPVASMTCSKSGALKAAGRLLSRSNNSSSAGSTGLRRANMPDSVQHIFVLIDEDAAGVPETGDAAHTPETQPDQAPETVDPQPQDGPDKGHPDTDVGAQQQGHPGQKLWAGKYQTPEDLERSYEELQRKLGEQGQQ